MLNEHVAFLGLGSNLGDKLIFIEDALKFLNANSAIEVEAVSDFYAGKPIDLHDERAENFINCVCRLKTSLKPEELLKFCQFIEEKFGRIRLQGVKSSRTIDVDLLFYDDLILKTENLILPHPEVLKRDFTLIPLGDVILPLWREPATNLTYAQLKNLYSVNSDLRSLGFSWSERNSDN